MSPKKKGLNCSLFWQLGVWQVVDEVVTQNAWRATFHAVVAGLFKRGPVYILNILLFFFVFEKNKGRSKRCFFVLFIWTVQRHTARTRTSCRLQHQPPSSLLETTSLFVRCDDRFEQESFLSCTNEVFFSCFSYKSDLNDSPHFGGHFCFAASSLAFFLYNNFHFSVIIKYNIFLLFKSMACPKKKGEKERAPPPPAEEMAIIAKWINIPLLLRRMRVILLSLLARALFLVRLSLYRSTGMENTS